AGLHLGDRTVVQRHPADQLDVEVALADRPPRRLAGQREGLRQEVVECLPIAGALAELVGLRAQLVVPEQLHLWLDLVDLLTAPLIGLELASLAHAQRARDHVPSVGHRHKGSCIAYPDPAVAVLTKLRQKAARARILTPTTTSSRSPRRAWSPF